MGSNLEELDSENDGSILQPTFILCEGRSDAAFFFRLVRERGLKGFQVGFAKGKTEFHRYLNGMRLRITPTLERIIIARDSDNDPAAALKDVFNQISAVKTHPYPVPTEAKTIAVHGTPHFGVLLLPNTDTPGTLETLLIESIKGAKPHIYACMQTFSQCAGTTAWDIGKLSKMQVHSMIAACCPKNPGGSLSMIWADSDNPISLSDKCFDELCSYLGQFSK